MLKLKDGFVEKTGRWGTPMVGVPSTGPRVVFQEEDGIVRIYGKRDNNGECRYADSERATAENWREVAHAHLIRNRQESPWGEA